MVCRLNVVLFIVLVKFSNTDAIIRTLLINYETNNKNSLIENETIAYLKEWLYHSVASFVRRSMMLIETSQLIKLLTGLYK